MATDGNVFFSIITPTVGTRPRALQQAVESVEAAVRHARLAPSQVELLIGFDGVKGTPPHTHLPMRSINFPPDNDWGNGIRNMLIRIARGRKLIFLDDDNTLKSNALRLYLKHFEAEMIIGRIDTQLAFDKPYIPEDDDGSLVRQGNVDPLCLCVSRELVADRCHGWAFAGKYEADYLNIRQWHRRAHSVVQISDFVGVYDAGRSLDRAALSRRQMNLLDRMAAERKDYSRTPAPALTLVSQ